jgi:hypothetical protein
VKLAYLVTKILDLLQMKVQLEEKTKGKDDWRLDIYLSIMR